MSGNFTSMISRPAPKGGKDLCIVVPSYNRPQAVQRLQEAFGATCTADTLILWVVDEGDPSREEYGPEVLVSPTRGMINALNTGALWAANVLGYRNIGFMGDDHLPRTRGWDATYVQHLDEMGTGMVYGNDLLQGEAIPTQISMTANIIQKLGWFAPAEFKHLCVDLCWKDLGQGIERLRYLDRVIIEHMHPAAGKADFDADYARVNDPAVVSGDAELYYAWKENELPGLVAKLKELL